MAKCDDPTSRIDSPPPSSTATLPSANIPSTVNILMSSGLPTPTSAISTNDDSQMSPTSTTKKSFFKKAKNDEMDK